MKSPTSFLVLSITTLFALLGARTASAQAASWRCVDDPGQSDCQESLINDIEDLTVAGWPKPLTLTMPPIPWSCTNQFSGARKGGSARWTLTWSGDLRSFLIGRHTATANIFGTVQVSGPEVWTTSWPSTEVSYGYQEGATEVMSQGGPTGVVDLGALTFITPAGSYWSGAVSVSLNSLTGGPWRCSVGYTGAKITVTGTNFVDFDYPVSLTPSHASLAEAIREQFRRGTRIAVTGSPL